jgi:hypothetical protein
MEDAASSAPAPFSRRLYINRIHPSPGFANPAEAKMQNENNFQAFEPIRKSSVPGSAVK